MKSQNKSERAPSMESQPRLSRMTPAHRATREPNRYYQVSSTNWRLFSFLSPFRGQTCFVPNSISLQDPKPVNRLVARTASNFSSHSSATSGSSRPRSDVLRIEDSGSYSECGCARRISIKTPRVPNKRSVRCYPDVGCDALGRYFVGHPGGNRPSFADEVVMVSRRHGHGRRHMMQESELAHERQSHCQPRFAIAQPRLARVLLDPRDVACFRAAPWPRSIHRAVVPTLF